MSRSRFQFSDEKNLNQERRRINPVMRGIGCIMMVIVPIFSYLVADQLIGNGFGVQVIPAAWYGNIIFPPLLMRLSGLATVLGFISRIPHLAANLAVTVVLVVIIGGVMSVVYGYIYQVFGPSKYGPTDAPPIKAKVKRYKR